MSAVFKSKINEMAFVEHGWVDTVKYERAVKDEHAIWLHAEALKAAGISNTASDGPKKRTLPASILGGYSMAALQELNLPPRECLLGNEEGELFFRQSINQLLAHRGVGKTMLGLSLAGALANGTDVLNFKTGRAVKVMYIDGELPLTQLKERAALLAKGEHSAENLFLINPESQRPASAIRLLDDYTWGQLLALLDQHGSEVVVLDSYSTLFWMDANKEEQQLGTQMRLQELRSRGLCVIALQHTGKDKVTQRGHSRNEDPLDTQILLTRPESATAGKVEFDLSYLKMRHSGAFQPTGTWKLEDGIWLRGTSGDEVAIQEYGITQAEYEQSIADGKARPTVFFTPLRYKQVAAACPRLHDWKKEYTGPIEDLPYKYQPKWTHILSAETKPLPEPLAALFVGFDKDLPEEI